MDIAINNKSVAMVRRLESGAAFVGWLDQKVPKYILGSEWAKRWCVVVSLHDIVLDLIMEGAASVQGPSLWQQERCVPKDMLGQPVGPAVAPGGEFPSRDSRPQRVSLAASGERSGAHCGHVPSQLTMLSVRVGICSGPKLVAAGRAQAHL